MGGVAYVDWAARADVMEALKVKHRRQTAIAEGCYKSRRSMNEPELNRSDDFEPTNLLELATQSITCEPLSPEEMMIRMEEEQFDELKLDFEPAAATATKKKEPRFSYTITMRPGISVRQQPAELSLAEYYAEIFGITPMDHTDLDEHHLGICCKEPSLRYRSRPNWATT